LTVALVVTLLVLVFARDVSRSAHGAISPRKTENRTFAALANAVVTQENDFDGHLTYLLTHGQTLTRPVFAARLEQLQEQLPLWQSEANLLRRPHLAHGVNDVLGQLTEQRADDYEVLLANVAHSMSLPWAATATKDTATSTVANAQSSLMATSEQWKVARWGLHREPGRVTLLATSNSSALLNIATVLGSLNHSVSLQVTRGIGISAVSVNPAPLPAIAGELLLPPTSSMRLGISVSNASYADQPVMVTVTLSPTNHLGVASRQSLSTTIGPLASFAFVPKLFSMANSEHAILTISVAGAPAGAKMSRLRRYSVIVSPSGNS
jgi:hypothetical protein